MPRAPLDLIYRREAVQDLEDLFQYISAERARAAERFLLEIKRACEGLRWFPMIGFRPDPEDNRVRVLTVRRRAAIKFFVHEGAVHILGISYRGRDLAAFFEGRQP